MARRSLRCLHLLPDTGDAGAESQALYLLRGLAELPEFDPELVYFGEGGGHENFAGLGIPTWHIPRRRRLTLDLPRRARELRKLVAARSPDLVHTWLYEANVVGLAALRTFPDIRLVVTERAGNFDRSQPMKLRLQRLLLPRADHAIANSREGATLLHDLGLAEERVDVVPNGIPAERVATSSGPAEVRRALGVPEKAPLVLAVGRPDPQKDFPSLLRAMAEVRAARPGARLVMVGPAPDDVRAWTVPSDHVTALGWRRDTANLMQAADLVAISSWAEGHSNVAGEAMLLGIPVVTTDAGEHPALVRRAGGRVVPIRDSGALAEAIRDVIDAPPSAQAIREVASRELSVTRFVDTTAAVYRRLLGPGT
jgi:glycosyltransferase involved in cell wall biosynthesis